MSENKNYWLKSGFLVVLQNLSGVLFGFGGFYFLIRIFDKHTFGIWTLFMATTTIFEMVRSGLIQNALIKFLSFSEKDKHPEILSSSFVLSGILTAVCILINISIAGFLSQIWDAQVLVHIFFIYSLVYLLSGVLSQFHWIEQANFRFTGIVVTNFIRQGGFFFYIVACYFFKIRTTLPQLVYVQALVLVAAIIVEYFFVRDLLKFPFRSSMEWIKNLLRYGKYAFGTSISSILSSTIDQMMLGSLLSPVASATFNIAVRIMNLVDIPTNAVAVILFPKSAQRMASEGVEGVKYLFEKSVGTVLAILIPGLLFLFFFPDLIIHLIAGERYSDTIPVLQVTVLYCLLIPFARQFGTVLDSMGKPKVNFLIVLLNAVLNLTLNYFMIIEYGVMGAAYATLISSFVAFTIAQIVLNRILKTNPFNAFIYAYRFYPEFYTNYVKPRLFKS